jgi:hypothetical protein
MVEIEGSRKSVYFRYYDPRILHAFLPTCAPPQVRDFFGPIKAFIVETDGVITAFTHSNSPPAPASWRKTAKVVVLDSQ